MSEIVIHAENVRKTYRRYKNNFQKIRHMIFLANSGEKIHVLKDVSFDIYKGEKVGIITAPGKGKSTIMGVMADIIRPEKGTVSVNGTVTTLFSHKLGFENALTGRDNYEIRASLLGWSREKMKEHQAEVFEFAGIDAVADEPIRTYKKGLAALLGFTIATVDKPDILLMDEKFSFGSKKNNKRAARRLGQLISGSETTFVMSVDDASIPMAGQLCERGLVIHKGQVVFDGTFEDAAAYYNENCKARSRKVRKEEALQEEEQAREDEISQENDTDNDADNDAGI